jgi:hypothetical protein
MENALMHHVGIGFLPEGFHPLPRFLSLSKSRLVSWILCSKRVRSSGTAYCANIVSSDSPPHYRKLLADA